MRRDRGSWIPTWGMATTRFMELRKRRGLMIALMAVNIGTRGTADALDLLEYCNHPGGTALSDARRANGASSPYGVRMWCLGNEMDGPWQIGQMTPEQYGRAARDMARAMHKFDPGLELVACGSSGTSRFG